MKPISELEESLSVHLDWNKSRLGCLARMILALIAVRTVNLVDLACAFSGSRAKAQSSYRRLQRFFCDFQVPYGQIAGLMYGLFVDDQKVYLSMDRTNWKWGKSSINILMLSLVHKGTAIPVYWRLLNGAGNSSTADRKTLVGRFVRHFGKHDIAGLLCDREFIGGEWFRYLRKEKIPFYIRVKCNAQTTNQRGQRVDMWTLFTGLKRREERVLKGARLVYGSRVYLTGVRCDDGELLIVASSEESANTIDIYRKRWEIETLFGCLKSRGFRFEETRLTDPERIGKLMAVLAIAFAWAHRVGEWRHEYREAIVTKKHGRLARSLFRHGLDFIRELLFFGKFSSRQFRQCLRRLREFRPPETSVLVVS